MLFFQLMSRRYERGSTVVTSNRGFEDRGEIFGYEVMAAALIDRPLHHCHIVNIRGNRYRLRAQRDDLLYHRSVFHYRSDRVGATDIWRALHSPGHEEENPSPKKRSRKQKEATAT